MSEIASAYVSLLPSAKGFGRKIESEIGGEVKKSGSKLGAGFGKMFALGGGLVAAAGIGSLISSSIGEAREAQKVGALTESIIKSTGAAAKVSASQVGDLAGAISLKTGMDDEAIQSGANLLLTFKNVKREGSGLNDIFGRATSAAADLSAAGFGDLNGQAKMLGKALNDPAKGISALTRSGVTFTEQQKAQIKTLVASGDSLKAQKIILKEVESQVGGAAAATATEGDKAAVAMGNLKEQVGTALLPVIDRLASTFTGSVAPAISGFITGMQQGTGVGGALVAVIGGLSAAVMGAASFLSQNKTAVLGLTVALGALVLVTQAHAAVLAVSAAGGLAAMIKGLPIVTTLTKTWAAVQWVLNAALTANPIGLIIAGLVALGAGLVVAYKKSETFRKIVDGAFAAVKVAASAVASFFTKKIPAAFEKVKTSASKALGWVKSNWPTILAVLTGPFGVAALLIVKNWDQIKAAGVAVLDWIQALPGKIKGAFSGAATLLKGAGKDVVNGLLAGLDAGKQWVIDKVKALADLIPNWLKKRLGIASPAKKIIPLGYDAARGLGVGLTKGKGAVIAGAGVTVNALEGYLEKAVAGMGSWGEKLGAAITTDGISTALKRDAKKLQGEVSKLGRSLNAALDKSMNLKGLFDDLKSTVSGAFVSDWFSAVGKEAEVDADGAIIKPATSAVQEFISGLVSNKGMLEAVQAAYTQLKAIPGLSTQFLSGLMASGNSELILGLAGGPVDAVQSANQLYAATNSLADSLGTNVANDQFGDGIYAVRDEVIALREAVMELGPEVGGVINKASAAGARKKRKSKKAKGK